jgi:hypothetical protein
MRLAVELHHWALLRQGPDIVLYGHLDGETHVSGPVIDLDLAGGTAVTLGGRYRLAGDPAPASVEPAEAAAEIEERRSDEIAAAKQGGLEDVIVEDGDG